MTHLKLAKVATLLCSALLLGGLTACGSTRNNLAPTTTPISQDQTSGIKLSVTQGSFVQGGQVSMQLEIDSSVATSASINLLSQSEVVFDRSHFDVQFNAHERLTFQIHAEIKEPGYYTVTAMGQGQAWKQSQTAMVGFNIASSDIAARTTGQTSLGNGGVETLEDHVKNLPEVTDFAFHVAKVKAELTGRKDFRRDFQYKGIQFKKADGTLTNPENMVVGYIPGTGSGKPNPDELEGPANQKIKGRVTTRSWCGASPAKIHVDIKNNNVNGAPTYNLNNFIVRVIDDNGIFSHDQIAAGIFDANGDFAYSQPNCDMFSPFWGDYSPPDTYFLIEARSPNSSTSSYNEGVRVVNTLGTQLFVQSGTYWDDRTLNRTIHLDANSHWTDNALWITRMAQFGQGLMKDAQVTPPGVAIFWPATFAGGTAYSPVARIILDGSLWVTADPLVHEYGHNVRYVTGVPWYFYNCLGAFLPCDPGFAALVGGYNHSPASSIPAQVAQNEGFAEYFYEMVKKVNPTQSGQNYTTPYPIPTNPGNWGQNIFRDCSTSNSCGFWSIPSGMTNEARVSSFFYRYTNEVLSCADGSKSDVAKFNRFMTGMMNTVVGELSQSVIGLWNNNLYRSFPTASYCPNEPDLTARRAKLKQILTDTTIATLVGTSYQGSTGEVVLIP